MIKLRHGICRAACHFLAFHLMLHLGHQSPLVSPGGSKSKDSGTGTAAVTVATLATAFLAANSFTVLDCFSAPNISA